MNIQGNLRSKFVDCKSFLESNSLDILAPCETKQDNSIDSGNFYVRGYLPLILKDSSTHVHGLAVYVKEGLTFARTYLQKTLQILNYVFDWIYFSQCCTSFSSINHLLRLCARFLILFHLAQTRFTRSTHLLIFLSLTGLCILVELKD